MKQDFRWGGINLRYLFHYLLKNIWMGIVLGIVFFLIGTILSDRSVSTTYSTEALVSVTQSRMAMLPDNLGNRIAYTNAAVTVLGSDAFMTQAREESGIYNVSVTSEVLPGTNIISIECTSDSPNSTYMFMRYLIENFSEIASDVSGDLKISMVQRPEIPRKGTTVKKSSLPAPLLAFAGVFMTLIVLCIAYALPIKYKGLGEVFKQYGDDIIELIPYNNDKTEKRSLFRKKKAQNTAYINALHKLTFIIKQIILKKNAKVLFFTSAGDSEGKQTICREIVSSLVNAGLNVFYMDGRLMSVLSRNTVSADMVVRDEDLGCDIIKPAEDGTTFSCESVEALLKELRTSKDAVIIRGVSGNDMTTLSLWSNLADKTYLIIRENTTDIRKIDALYKNLKYTSNNLGGCILNAFY